MSLIEYRACDQSFEKIVSLHFALFEIGSEKDITVHDAKQIQIIAAAAINLAKSHNRSTLTPQLNAKFGVPFVHFLASWSGLHGSPFSFCNISQARTIVQYARESVRYAAQIWGRKLSAIEEILLDIGEADSESGVLSGGFTSIAKNLYEASLEKLSLHGDGPMTGLLQAHCVSCLTRLQLTETADESESVWIKSAETEKGSMGQLQLMLTSNTDSPHFYVWRETSSFRSSVEYHISLKRQLVAESLLAASRPDEAQGILEDAVRDSPQNYDVAFAYGSFLLRRALYNDRDFGPDFVKNAQMQLLKAAKLNTKKADPFALLGLWYEVQGDSKRSVGCYSKALLIDPSHPVAGRGILRMKSFQGVSSLCDNAMNQGIFQNGWAWKSAGDSKALLEGDDERAVICYQQALRARDVDNPRHHRLSIFFCLPSSGVNYENRECSNTWASLGGCYRRLGKHSASLRAFQSAFDIFPQDFSYFCSWAQGMNASSSLLNHELLTCLSEH